ncbi:MAG TPA: hypothetical protein VF037_09990 [Gemmatimonadales bacterium]
MRLGRGVALVAALGGMAGPLAAQAGHGHGAPPAADSARAADSAFAAVQERGKQAMGVDQYTSAHRFDPLPDGGRIVLVRDAADTAGVRTIREHMQEIREAFRKGDFTIPGFVHDRDVPGTRVLAAKRSELRIVYRPVAGGGELQLATRDPEVVKAIHEFLAFQRMDHRVDHGH